MSPAIDRWNGRVEAVPLRPRTAYSAENSDHVETWAYRWHPPWESGEVMPGLPSIDFDVLVRRDGVRQFAPANGAPIFVQHAASAGLDLHCARSSLDHADSVAPAYESLIYNRVRQMQECSHRRFRWVMDLVASRTRRTASERSVLPLNLGLDSRGEGTPWSIERLLDEGRAAIGPNAEADVESQIARGLDAAARLAPQRLSDAGVAPLVRLALFDLDPNAPLPDSALLERIRRRLTALLEAHRDDSREQFESWWSGPKSNMFKALSQRRTAGRAGISQAEARAGFLELGWRSHFAVAGFVATFAQAFKAALHDPLSPEEERLFDAIYLPQAYLGGLPLVMLSDRNPLLAPAVLRIWHPLPDEDGIGVLHTVLSFVGELIRIRRQTDRRRRGPATRDSDAAATLETHLQTAFAARDVRCPRCGKRCQMTFDASNQSDPIKVGYSCRRHRHFGTLTIPYAELRAFAPSEDDA